MDTLEVQAVASLRGLAFRFLRVLVDRLDHLFNSTSDNRFLSRYSGQQERRDVEESCNPSSVIRMVRPPMDELELAEEAAALALSVGVLTTAAELEAVDEPTAQCISPDVTIAVPVRTA